MYCLFNSWHLGYLCELPLHNIKKHPATFWTKITQQIKHVCMLLTLLVWWAESFLYGIPAGVLWLFPFEEETFPWDQILSTWLQSVRALKQRSAGVFSNQLCVFGSYLWAAGDVLKYQKTCVLLQSAGGRSHLEESHQEDFKPVKIHATANKYLKSIPIYFPITL